MKVCGWCHTGEFIDGQCADCGSGVVMGEPNSIMNEPLTPLMLTALLFALIISVIGMWRLLISN